MMGDYSIHKRRFCCVLSEEGGILCRNGYDFSNCEEMGMIFPTVIFVTKMTCFNNIRKWFFMSKEGWWLFCEV